MQKAIGSPGIQLSFVLISCLIAEETVILTILFQRARNSQGISSEMTTINNNARRQKHPTTIDQLEFNSQQLDVSAGV